MKPPPLPPSARPWDPERHAAKLAPAGAAAAVAGVLVGGWPGGVLAALGLALLLLACWAPGQGLLLTGPAARWELVRIVRKQKPIVWRTVYALGLFSLLLVVYGAFFPFEEVPAFSAGATLSLREWASFAAAFSTTFLAVQFFTLVGVTPSLTADAIAEEKDRKALDFLLVTDLRNREIVFGKLAARLAHLFSLLLTGLPIVALMPLLGGVEPVLIAAVYAVTGATVLSLTGVSALCSVNARKAKTAVGVAYTIAFGYLAFSGVCWLIEFQPGWPEFPSTPTWQSPVTVHDLIEVVNAGNPLSVVILLGRDVQAGIPLDDVLPGRLRGYLAFHALVLAAFGLAAVARLRTVAARQAGSSADRPAVAGEPPKRPPINEANPVVWRELYCDVPRPRNLFQWVLVWVVVVLMFAPLAVLLFAWATGLWGDLGEYTNGVVRGLGTLLLFVILLAAGNQAAITIPKERERQTLDGLLLTGLGAEEIYWQKWLAAVLLTRGGYVYMVLAWLVAALVGGLHPLALPGLVLGMVAYGTFGVSLGLWCGVLERTQVKAGARLTAYCFWIALGAGVLAGVLSRLSETAAFCAAAALIPPVAVAVMAFRAGDFREFGGSGELLALVVSILIGVALYAHAARKLYRDGERRFARARGGGKE